MAHQISHSRYVVAIRKFICMNSRLWDVSKRFRTGRLERELKVVQLSATRCSFISIL